MYLHEKCTTLKIIIVSSSSSVQHVCRLFGLIPIKPCGSLPLWTRIRVEKRKVAHLLNKFSVSYGTRRFITVYTRPLYVPCSRLNRYSERCNEIRLYFNLPQKKNSKPKLFELRQIWVCTVLYKPACPTGQGWKLMACVLRVAREFLLLVRGINCCTWFFSLPDQICYTIK